MGYILGSIFEFCIGVFFLKDFDIIIENQEKNSIFCIFDGSRHEKREIGIFEWNFDEKSEFSGIHDLKHKNIKQSYCFFM